MHTKQMFANAHGLYCAGALPPHPLHSLRSLRSQSPPRETFGSPAYGGPPSPLSGSGKNISGRRSAQGKRSASVSSVGRLRTGKAGCPRRGQASCPHGELEEGFKPEGKSWSADPHFASKASFFWGARVGLNPAPVTQSEKQTSQSKHWLRAK